MEQATNDLVAALIRAQIVSGRSHVEWAKLLELSPSGWDRVRNGRNPGHRFRTRTIATLLASPSLPYEVQRPACRCFALNLQQRLESSLDAYSSAVMRRFDFITLGRITQDPATDPVQGPDSREPQPDC